MTESAYCEYKSLTSGTRDEYFDASLHGAFCVSDTVRFSVRVPYHCDCTSVTMEIHEDGLSGYDNRREINFDLCRKTLDYREYCTDINMRELCQSRDSGLFYYHYRIADDSGVNCFGGEAACELTPTSLDGDRQLLVYCDGFDTPRRFRGGIMYHIFVDRFARSGKCPIKQGANFHENWHDDVPEYPGNYTNGTPNRDFFGGDLYGIRDKLDYIASLGVTCVYLSPIFESPSNHKYDTADYMKVDECFGGDAALAELISACDEYDISVILDGVFNHTGDDSVYFNKYGTYGDGGAYRDNASPYHEWYNFGDCRDKYECWWGIPSLPRVRCDYDGYRKFLFGDGGIFDKWQKLGIGGWRLDVADELSDSFLKELRNKAKNANAENIVYGEVWEDASNKISYGIRRAYLCGEELDAVINYPLRQAVIAYLRDGDGAIMRRTAEGIYRRYPKMCADVLMNVLGTHDTARILTALVRHPDDNFTNAEKASFRLSESERQLGITRLKLAYLIVSFMYGVPCVFYGDEAGIEGFGDPFCRMPFPWGKEDVELTDDYQRIGKLRRSEKVLENGEFRIIHCSSALFCFVRYNAEHTLLVAVNLSEHDMSVRSKCSGERLYGDGRSGTCHRIRANGGTVIRFKGKYEDNDIAVIQTKA